tara:strand:+ start:133961 stop:134755 length:795 start_codon:yes stop_codon:yes gene_type:complete
MIILGVDTETTGITEEGEGEEGESEIVEAGFTLYDTERELVLATFGMIYKTERESAPGAFDVHKIPREVSLYMPTYQECLNPYEVIRADLADYMVAHNAPHDHPKVVKAWPDFLKMKWLCTQRDVDHEAVLPRKVFSRRLGHLCVDYGINLAGWHRAVADAEACTRIAGKHDLDAAYAYKIKPKFRLICEGPFLKNVDAKAELSQAPSVLNGGKTYRWNVEGYPKCWSKEGLLKEEVIGDADCIKKFSGGRWQFNLEKMDPPVY